MAILATCCRLALVRIAFAMQAGLALDPSFTIRRFRDATNARSDNATFLAWRDRTIEGMRMAGVPDG
jgi:hypothetical protein